MRAVLSGPVVYLQITWSAGCGPPDTAEIATVSQNGPENGFFLLHICEPEVSVHNSAYLECHHNSSEEYVQSRLSRAYSPLYSTSTSFGAERAVATSWMNLCQSACPMFQRLICSF
ncbi:unnamed protein product [Strongylus vulgaris]|uniref:Uncharacterized protein n=1 Tax=Strongylus vulgaris TaxID=40348 RepID=A0A3P7JCM1_STRVU|nr:unnamed protein product [Strongylus vulgaris]